MVEGDTSLAGQRVLVTGGSGFVGRTLVPEFLRHGADVVVLDRQSFPGADVPTIRGDLTDPAVRDAAVTPDLTGIVHLAAITSVLRSAEQPQETFDTNVEVTQGLLELARRRHVGQFVLASTNAVVGNVGTSTITEDSPLRPLTPYGATKAACEMLLSGYAGAYGLATCALRFTNIYGPGMAAKDSFVPRLMRAALAGEGVQVYGDGKQARDLVHVSDIAAGVVAAWGHRHAGTAILGAGRSVTVLDLIEAARAATGTPLPVAHVPAKTGEMPAVIVDIARAATEFGYQPKIGLTEGLRTVWADFVANSTITATPR
ncbi:MAG TPA: NAD(P)-dependent oxidoreductase [Pseudonocardiaceae bacterium]|jgi:UDP-glucose 4-epimerase|nr:NAD(P)-dependent oxidoreductase [Pseudonocardiaceae bacterium]